MGDIFRKQRREFEWVEREKLQVWKPGWQMQADEWDVWEWGILPTCILMVPLLLPRGRGRLWLGCPCCWEGLPGHRGHIRALWGDSSRNTPAGGVSSGRGHRGDGTGMGLLTGLQQEVNPLQDPRLQQWWLSPHKAKEQLLEKAAPNTTLAHLGLSHLQPVLRTPGISAGICLWIAPETPQQPSETSPW